MRGRWKGVGIGKLMMVCLAFSVCAEVHADQLSQILSRLLYCIILAR